ncbi:hypothetical protein [Actinoplanes sp. NPDC051851]|uniref:hypothetical protein n=1 Tax=Actinoplanes sp. NPDC051851 TaxID=3154753 RepID=UPI0034310298
MTRMTPMTPGTPVAAVRRDAVAAVLAAESDVVLSCVVSVRDETGSWTESDAASGFGIGDDGFGVALRTREVWRHYDRAEPWDGEVCCILMHCPAGAVRLRATDARGGYLAEVSETGLALLLSPVGAYVEVTVEYGDERPPEHLTLHVLDAEQDALPPWERSS